MNALVGKVGAGVVGGGLKRNVAVGQKNIYEPTKKRLSKQTTFIKRMRLQT